MSVFGNITTPPQVEAAVTATLKKWSPTYLREMERLEGLEPKALPDIASWRATDEIADRFPEQAIPAVQLQFTSDIDLVTLADDVAAQFLGTIDVVVQAGEAERARELASLYAFHLGLIVLQKPELDGSVACIGTAWVKLGTPEVGKMRASSRWLAVGSSTVRLTVEGVAAVLEGPAEPVEPEGGTEPPPEYPEATTHDLIVEPEVNDA